MAAYSGQMEKINRQENEKLSSHSERLLILTRTVLVFCGEAVSRLHECVVG